MRSRFDGTALWSGFFCLAFAAPTASADEAIVRTVRDWYEMGGFVMHGLVACSVVVLGITAERVVALRRGAVVPRRLVREVKRHAAARDVQGLEALASSGRSSLARLTGVAARALDGGDRATAEQVLAEVAVSESGRLAHNLPLLAAIANIATMLGLLGTVLGMIDAFEMIASTGTSDAGVVAGGIFRALVTTAAGLSVGIVTLAIHTALRRRVEGFSERLEDALNGLLDAWQRGQEAPEGPVSVAAVERVVPAAVAAEAP